MLLFLLALLARVAVGQPNYCDNGYCNGINAAFVLVPSCQHWDRRFLQGTCAGLLDQCGCRRNQQCMCWARCCLEGTMTRPGMF